MQIFCAKIKMKLVSNSHLNSIIVQFPRIAYDEFENLFQRSTNNL